VSAFAMNSVSRPGAEDACRPILAALLASPGESELKPAKRRPVMGVFSRWGLWLARMRRWATAEPIDVCVRPC
jgi:hypothetical protein